MTNFKEFFIAMKCIFLEKWKIQRQKRGENKGNASVVAGEAIS